MSKKKKLTPDEKVRKALEELPCPIIDTKHGIKIYCVNDRARSNQSRIEHIVLERHSLMPSDIERIPKYINESELIMDKERKYTFNLYIKRNNYSNEYIKMSLNLDFSVSNKAKIKTIFITKVIK